MDTGSVGIIVGTSYFNPPANGRLDPSFIGPGSETLTSSGIIFSGDWYKTTVNLYNGNGVVASSTVPVMAVTKVSCEPNARECDPSTIGGTAPTTHYFGIGFAGGAGQPQGTPDKNAFLNVMSISGSASQLSPGYILSTQGVEIGLTSRNTQGFALIKLEPLLAPDSTQWQTAPASANVLTDWQHPRGTITVNGSSGSGSILFDTGVSTGFLTPPIGVTLQTGMGPQNAECNGSTPPSCAVQGSSVQVSFPNLSIPPTSNPPAPVASLHYTVGANNGSQSGNPVSPFALSVEHNSAPFLNTTVRFLQAFNYFYDAANGFLGLQTTGKTPARYATSTSSGLAIQGVFQCFFSWAEANFSFQSFDFGPDVHRVTDPLSIAGLTPIRRTSGFPPVVRRLAIRPLQLPTMYTFWQAAADSLRVKGLYPVGCLPRVASRIITVHLWSRSVKVISARHGPTCMVPTPARLPPN